MVVFSTGNSTGKSLSQFISDIETGGSDENLTPGNLPEGSLVNKLRYIASQSENDVLYDIVIDSDIIYGSNFNGVDGDEVISSRGKNVVIHIHSASSTNIKTITLGGRNNLFDIKSNITLKLSDIILKGISNNTMPLLYVGSGAKLIIEDGTNIIGNTSSNTRTLATGIQVYNGVLTMNGGFISGHKATGVGGNGAVGLMNNSYFIMNGGIIEENEAYQGGEGSGGGLYFENSTVTMNGGEIRNNKSYAGGGVLMGKNSFFVMNNGKINGNSASVCGGVALSENCSFTMNGGEINGNIGTENAGGVFIFETGSFTMTGGVIKGNTAGDSGGGIYAVDKTLTVNGGGSRITVSITGGEIIGNTAMSGGGIGLYNSRFTKTGGYIAGTDAGINANISTRNEGPAVIYCRDYIFWDRKLSLTSADDLSTDDLDNGWTYLGAEGEF